MTQLAQGDSKTKAKNSPALPMNESGAAAALKKMGASLAKNEQGHVTWIFFRFDTEVNDKHLELISRLTELEELPLANSKISDEGILYPEFPMNFHFNVEIASHNHMP